MNHRIMIGIRNTILGCLCELIVMVSLCEAHPHNWVTMRSEFKLNERDELVSIKQVWRFDYFFSAMLIAETVNEWRQPLHKALELEARRMVKNLASYRYFSVLSIDERDIPLPAPNHYALQVVSAEEQQLLELRMDFNLEQRPNLTGAVISWSVYDPTYYIAYSHEHAGNVTIRHASAIQCDKQLKLPKLTEELIMYAFSLDQTQRDTDGLGLAFAEKIVIKCNLQEERS